VNFRCVYAIRIDDLAPLSPHQAAIATFSGIVVCHHVHPGVSASVIFAYQVNRIWVRRMTSSSAIFLSTSVGRIATLSPKAREIEPSRY
jgi:hypothetical protein